MSRTTVEIAKIHPYRSARLHGPSIVFPRHLFDFVYNEIPQNKRDNHIVVECSISDENKTEDYAIKFTDFSAIVMPLDDGEVVKG